MINRDIYRRAAKQARAHAKAATLQALGTMHPNHPGAVKRAAMVMRRAYRHAIACRTWYLPA